MLVKWIYFLILVNDQSLFCSIGVSHTIIYSFKAGKTLFNLSFLAFLNMQIFITNVCQSYWSGAVVISVGHYKNNSTLNLFMKLLLSELLSSQDVMLAMCSGTAAWGVKRAAFAAVSYCKKIHLHPPKYFPHKHICKGHLYKFCHLCFTFEIHRFISYLQKLVWKCIMSSQNNQVDQVGLNGLNQEITYQRIWVENRNVFFLYFFPVWTFHFI